MNSHQLLFERLDRLEQLLVSKKEVLTFDEACDYAGISRSYLYKLTASGKVPHSKPNGKLIFFSRQKFEAWLIQSQDVLELKDPTKTNSI
ncbi:helix-turn-helix domain-containing protein [Formosa sp. L2A11]|uniref:helix-turn-helix domain-containing protein n=1 Tax=Formosa sp. L2A11 TaxID=2686363 RepID=UPI00131CD340|nr:helix-turn-helix domain-containing protein [Formosa sp. L2A11]